MAAMSTKELKKRKRAQLERLAEKGYVEPSEKVFDPIVTFGMHKSEGLKLSELPGDYVQYLCGQTDDGEDFVHRGVNWTRAAKAELARRAAGGPLPKGVPLPVEEDDDVKPLKNAHARAKTEMITISLWAVDFAARHLLKDFITRKDKSELFTEWLRKYAQEAARYGKLLWSDIENEWVENLAFSYRGHVFEVRVAKSKLTLGRIASDSDD